MATMFTLNDDFAELGSCMILFGDRGTPTLNALASSLHMIVTERARIIAGR
jgi:hypothetical protein